MTSHRTKDRREIFRGDPAVRVACVGVKFQNTSLGLRDGWNYPTLATPAWVGHPERRTYSFSGSV